MQNSETNYGLEEAGMAQMDDSIGALLKHLDDIGEANNTIVIFTTDNGAEVFTWPDGGMTPFKNTKGTVGEGGFRVPCIIRWPGQVKPGTVENGIFSGLDWFPTLTAAAGNPEHHRSAAEGREARRPDLQEPSRWLQPDGSAHRQRPIQAPRVVLLRRRRSWARFASTTSSSTFYQQPWGWPGEKITTDMPVDGQHPPGSVRAHADHSRRVAEHWARGYMNDFFAREFWRFVLVQQDVGKLALTAVDYPPMQDPASFNLEAVKKKIEEMIKNRPGQ